MLTRVLYIDLYNLTLDGVSRTSDGFHSLSDVNMIKASYVLNIMDAMSRLVSLLVKFFHTFILLLLLLELLLSFVYSFLLTEFCKKWVLVCLAE